MAKLDAGTKALFINIYYDLWICLVIPLIVVIVNANIKRKLYKLKNFPRRFFSDRPEEVVRHTMISENRILKVKINTLA